MTDIYRMSMTKKELLERVGDIFQICDARQMEFTDGRSTGVKTIEVTTGSGFAFTVVPSRNLDISRASFNGIPVAWRSAVGETSPYFYQPEGMEWLRSFFGGLLTTCGISYSSHPCEDNGEELGLHGRTSNIPAEDVSIAKAWNGDSYDITISGQVREVGVFRDNLILSRTIGTSLGSSSLKINDVVTNAGFRPAPVMMLYHINPGWPVVSEHSRLYAPVISSKAFDANADKEMDIWDRFIAPQKDYPERCYLHRMKADSEGMVNLCMINEKLGIGLYEKYPAEEFPYFIQWKMMNRGEYVVGLEPGNITGNRAAMRDEGTLEILEPGEERRFSIELGVLYGNSEIDAFKNTIKESHK